MQICSAESTIKKRFPGLITQAFDVLNFRRPYAAAKGTLPTEEVTVSPSGSDLFVLILKGRRCGKKRQMSPDTHLQEGFSEIHVFFFGGGELFTFTHSFMHTSQIYSKQPTAHPLISWLLLLLVNFQINCFIANHVYFLSVSFIHIWGQHDHCFSPKQNSFKYTVLFRFCSFSQHWLLVNCGDCSFLIKVFRKWFATTSFLSWKKSDF